MTIARVRVSEDADWPTLSLAGEVDLSNVDDLGRELEQSVANAARGVVLDLSDLTYLDSTGLRLVFRLARQLRDRQQVLCLVVPQSSLIRRVLTLGGVGSVATVVASIDAVSEVKGRDA